MKSSNPCVVLFLLLSLLAWPVLADSGEGGGEHGGGGEGGESGGEGSRPERPETPSESTIYFPDYVDGEGWSVQLTLGNLDLNQAVSVDIEVYDQQGDPVAGFFDGDAKIEIPARGSQTLSSVSGDQIRRGWISVRSLSNMVHGLLTYRDMATGIEVGVEPVPLGNSFAMFVEESTAIGTGLALFLPGATAQVGFTIVDQDGNDPLGEAQVMDAQDFRQAARTLPEWYREHDQSFLQDFRGILFLHTPDGSPFAPLGLRFGKLQGSLSTIPVISLSGGSGCSGGSSTEPGESGTQYGLSETAREVRGGVELIARYDREGQRFTGTVHNTNDATVSQVRVEVHLSNGVELGPSPRVDLAPGETKSFVLDAMGQDFTCYSIHVELGSSGS